MLLVPHSREELARSLAQCSANGQPVTQVDVREMNALLEYHPEDMTATAEAGLTVAELQAHLGRARQWLPIDPPNASALTIGELLAFNWSGPRRFGYGTIRDSVIGIKVALANGDIIKAGGKVVKNVAGYDLCKLFIGAKHSLGIIVEATFKLRPLPEREIVLESSFSSIADLQRAASALSESSAEPVILDAHNAAENLRMVTSFAGAEEDVEYQLDIARGLASWTETSTNYDQRYASILSVLPSRTAEVLQRLGDAPFVARLGNGVIYHDGPAQSERCLPNAALAARLKQAYDSRGILPQCSL